MRLQSYNLQWYKLYKEIDIEAKKNHEKLDKEINEYIIKHSTPPLNKRNKPTKTKVIIVSNTDLDSSIFFKSEKRNILIIQFIQLAIKIILYYNSMLRIITHMTALALLDYIKA